MRLVYRVLLTILWVKFTIISFYHDTVLRLANLIYTHPMFIIRVGAYLPKITHKFILRRAFRAQHKMLDLFDLIYDNLDALAMKLNFMNEKDAGDARLDMESEIYETIPGVLTTLVWMNLYTGTQLPGYKNCPEFLPEFLDDEFVTKAAIMGGLEDCLQKFGDIVGAADEANKANLLE